MPAPDTRSSDRRTVRSPVFVVAAVVAVAYAVIGLARQNYQLAAIGPAIMIAYAVVLFLFRGRSEPIGMLAGNRADERQAQVQLRAVAATGQVLVATLVVGAMWSLAAGWDSANVFCILCAIGGAAFIGFTVLYSRRG
jgi:hypothetical protein